MEEQNTISLHFVTGPLAGKSVDLDKPVITIGRDRQNDIVLLDQSISRFHARIVSQDGVWSIENLSSHNPLVVNSEKVQQGVLTPDSEVGLGSTVRFTVLMAPASNATISSSPASMMPGQSTLPMIPEQLLAQTTLQPPAKTLGTLPIEENVLANALRNASPSDTMLAPLTEKGKRTLTVSSNIHSSRQVHVLHKAITSIGRSSENDIVIADPIISAFHAQIVQEGNDLYFVHPHPARKQTLNGVWYQGVKIAPNQEFRKRLTNGDIFRIGDEHGTLISLLYDDGTGIAQEDLPEMRPIPLTQPSFTIGRAEECAIVLNHPQVSAHHALLEKSEGGYSITDTNSTNHVYVNGQQIERYLLRTGDEIRIGPYRLVYTGTELRQYNESGHIRIDALHLKKVGNNNVILLDDISLTIPPRKFVAIVGGSGAGKSTLMDALNGLRLAQQGSVLYNGVDYYSNLAAFNTQLGYVPQDDIVHRDLTVERALYYAARLRLPSDFSSEQIKWRIDEVLEDVEMTERRDLLVSKLSGGQRKRVSIALELLANPSVFFLDEPTSGLDPGLDRKMMALLRRLADRGRTIILVTHATNNINTCDYVCFLAQGGRLAYFGPPNEAKQFFEKTDFAEIYSTLEPSKESPNVPQLAEERFVASKDYQQYVAVPQQERAQAQQNATSHAAGGQEKQRAQRGRGWSQFLLLSMRYLELLRNDRINLLILLLQAPIIAVMLVLLVRFEVGAGVFDANKLVQCRTQILTPSGPLAMPQARQTELIDCSSVQAFLRNNAQGQAYATARGGVQQALQDFIILGPGADAQKVLFIMAFATVLFGCINGTREIVKEAAIYKRERTVNLGILPYMFSKIAVLGLLCLLQSLVLTVVVEVGEPLHQGIFLSPVLETYITLCLTSLVGLMIGLTISAIAPNTDRAISFVPIILLPQVVFSGAIIALKDWVTQILAVIFPTRWAMAALGSSIGLHAETVGGDRLFGDDYTYHSTLYSIYSQTDAVHRLLLCWGALVIIILVLALLIGYFLKRKDVRA